MHYVRLLWKSSEMCKAWGLTALIQCWEEAGHPLSLSLGSALYVSGTFLDSGSITMNKEKQNKTKKP